MKNLLFFILIFTAATAHAKPKLEAEEQLKSYARLVYLNYQDTYNAALDLQKAVENFTSNPTEAGLEAAKKAWLKTRDPYGQTEAFRFYEGPIDSADRENNTRNREEQINAWPLNEAYIDYVQGNDKAGIINDPTITLSKETLTKKNIQDDEANVATGFHAIEFLLWGQDINRDGPGLRTFKDYTRDEVKGKVDPIKERRRQYLKLVTDKLVDDLKYLVEAWQPEQDNYAASFVKQDPKDGVGKILTGIATLSGFELSAERMATALDSGDQEDEQSCFSDSTHNDFIYNAKGIKNVFYATYNDFRGTSLYDLIQARNDTLADRLAKQLDKTEKLVGALPQPIDREILASPKGSKSREKMERAVESLQKQAELFKEAGKILGIHVNIIAE